MIDAVAAFQLETAPARGRYAQLSAGTIDPILRRHDYPRPVALLLGEALTLATLVGSLFKVQGRLTVQAEGQGAVPLLVAEYAMDGGLRGYARFAPDDPRLKGDSARAPLDLLGADAVLMISLDQGPDMDLMQGVVPLEGETLAACAESYFLRSEQTATRIRLAVGEVATPGQSPAWRSAGALLQRIAGDAARPAAQDEWETAETLFATLTDHELVDPDLGVERVLFRLFHEGGVRLATGAPVADRCGCDASRVLTLLRRFGGDLEEYLEPDGKVHARCQFCSRLYLLDPLELATPVAR